MKPGTLKTVPMQRHRWGRRGCALELGFVFSAFGSTVLEPHLTIGGADASMAPGTSSVALVLVLQHY